MAKKPVKPQEPQPGEVPDPPTYHQDPELPKKGNTANDATPPLKYHPHDAKEQPS
ncbi:MAG: hypothetical protein WAP47_18830 [Candidatus Rokuibacteriota bacterium]